MVCSNHMGQNSIKGPARLPISHRLTFHYHTNTPSNQPFNKQPPPNPSDRIGDGWFAGVRSMESEKKKNVELPKRQSDKFSTQR